MFLPGGFMKLDILIALTSILVFTGISFAEQIFPPVVQPKDLDFTWPPAKTVGEKDFFYIAKNGQPACAIVLPAKVDKRIECVAELVQIYLKVITGAEFEIKKEPYTVGSGIYIGNTLKGRDINFTTPKLKYPGGKVLPNLFGFIVKTLDKNTVVIKGLYDNGTISGVTSFIREYLGVRRYFPSNPGGFGDVYEKKPTLVIPDIIWYDWPYFISRYIGLQQKGWEIEAKKSYMLILHRTGSAIAMMHNYFELLPVEKYGKTHPEYYAEVDGKRLVSDSKLHWQFCVSNPEVVDVVAATIIDIFDKQPGKISHALAVNDGWGDCECKNCLAMDLPDSDINTRTRMTERYIIFMNAVAEKVATKHPDKLLGFLAYASLKDAPVSTKTHPSLIPYICAMRESYYHWDEWVNSGAKVMGYYGYHDDNRCVIPRINPHQEAKRIRYLVGTGTGAGIYEENNPTYPLTGHLLSVIADLLWDPRLDENELLSKYYSGMFIESEKPMRMFFETLEKGYEEWLVKYGAKHPYGYDWTDLNPANNLRLQFEALPVEYAKTAWQYLLDAEQLAKDEKVKQRIDLIKKTFRFVIPCVNEHYTMKKMLETTDTESAIKLSREAVKYSREKAEYKADVIENGELKNWLIYNKGYYKSITTETITSDVLAAIDQAFSNISKTNPKTLTVWEKLRDDNDPVIAQSAETQVALINKIGELKNLVLNPSFEDDNPIPKFVKPEYESGNMVLDDSNAHTGKRSLLIKKTRSSNIVFPIEAAAGEKFIFSFWYNTNNSTAACMVYTIPQIDKKNTYEYSKIIEPTNNQWQEVKFIYTTPPKTTSVEFRIFISKQHTKSKVWVDDVTIYRLPVKKLVVYTEPDNKVINLEENAPK